MEGEEHREEDDAPVLPDLSVGDSIIGGKSSPCLATTNECSPQIQLTDLKFMPPTKESDSHGRLHHGVMEPAIGLAFETENAAFDCYNEYAKKMGFTVRWDNRTLSRRTGVTLARRFVCSKQGRRGDGQKKRHSQAKYHREETRCGCLAYMKIKLAGDGKYRIIELNPSHNHPLASQAPLNYALANVVIYNQVPGACPVPMSVPSIPHTLPPAQVTGILPRPSHVPYNHPVAVFLPISPQQVPNHPLGGKSANTPGSGHVMIMQRVPGASVSASGKPKRKRKSSIAAGTITDSSEIRDVEAPLAGDISRSREMEGLESLPAEARNYLPTKRPNPMMKSDVDALLEYFRSKQAQSPSFFYSFQLNAEEKITNVFWMDGKMKTDYERFGDVVCFDTTYRMNDYSHPVALFTGVNHHKQMIIFGVALLYDETVHSFKWVFSTFLKVVSGKRPATLFTEDHPSIVSSLPSELGKTLHRLCAWHLYQDAARNLAKVFTGSKDFEEDFAGCLRKHDVEDEFVRAWNSMLEKYNLVENSWLRQRFIERERWAPVYGKTAFSGDILSAQLRERMNRELRKHLSSCKDMDRFLQGFEKLLEDRRGKELEANTRMTKSSPCAPPVSIIQQAARVYTSAAFDMFMAEYVAGLECLIRERNNDGSAEVLAVEDGQGYKHQVRVNLEEENLSCSCFKFERVGVLCGHVLKCLIKRVRSIPEKYILRRWTRCAGNVRLVCGEGDEREGDILSHRYGSLVHDFVRLAVRSLEDEETYACVRRRKEALAEEMEKVFKEKSSSLSYHLFGEHVW
ncbi:protein FAR1-RELATED SEQUENCE 5-like isoform X2 [Wolffia australiana]